MCVSTPRMYPRSRYILVVLLFLIIAIINLTPERSDAHLVDALDDYIDNQYIKMMPDQKFDIADNDEIEKNEQDPHFSFEPSYHSTRKIAYELGLEDNQWIYEDDFLDNFEEYEDDIEWEYWDNSESRGKSKK